MSVTNNFKIQHTEVMFTPVLPLNFEFWNNVECITQLTPTRLPNSDN